MLLLNDYDETLITVIRITSNCIEEHNEESMLVYVNYRHFLDYFITCLKYLMRRESRGMVNDNINNNFTKSKRHTQLQLRKYPIKIYYQLSKTGIE